MRLNALYPSDNPMEELLFCFGGDDSGGGDGGAGGSAGDFEGTNFGGDTATAGGDLGGGGDGGDSGFDAFDASGDYVSSAISDFAAGPSTTASGGYSNYGGGDNDRDNDGIPDTIDIDAGTGTGVPMGGGRDTSPVTAPTALATPTAAITPTFAPTLANQPLTVGGQVAVMPYESYQRSPAQVFGYGGLTAAPYSPSAISFQGGQPATTVSPLGSDQIMQFDVGRAPSPAGVADDRNFIEKTMDRVGSLFDTQEQRAGVFDPTTGTFRQFDGQTTLQKTSDNVIADVIGNALTGAMGITGLTGILDSKTYQPLAGGEEQLYQSALGGLLSDYIGENLTPMSEIRAAQEAAMGGEGGDGGQEAPLIVPEQTPEEERAQSAFPAFTPRRFEYQPFTSKFYTIPSRFTRPTSLLG